MSKYVFIVGILVLISAIVGLFVVLMLSITENYGEFEYATNSGETGTASFCAISFGQARCRTDDGTTIMVERYTKK